MPIDIENESLEAPAPVSYVYMFYSAGRIKIGVSTDPMRRLDQLTTRSPTPVQVVFCAFGDRNTERSLHAKFSADRLHGEWFALSDDIREFINDGVFAAHLRAAERTWEAHQRRVIH